METVSVIEIIATIIGTMGGWEAIKYLLNRKTNKRKEEAEADGVEFGVLRDSMEFLPDSVFFLKRSAAKLVIARLFSSD